VKKISGLLVILALIIILFIGFAYFSQSHAHINTNKPASLDPIINISSPNNLVTGLTVNSFSNGQAFNLSFTPINTSQTQNLNIQIPKYAIISLSYYNNTGYNFTGNIVFTPQVSGVSSTAKCTTNHTGFTGYALVNGVNTSISNKNFEGGLYSASGSCSVAPSCGSSLNPNPSASCDTNPSSSTSQSDPSPYTGGSCSSSVVYSNAVTSQTNTEPGVGSVSCTGASTGQCSNNPSCSLSYLSYTSQSATNTCPDPLTDTGCVFQGSCSASASDAGTTSISTQCGNYALPSATSSCINYEKYNQPGPLSNGNYYPGYTVTCPTNTYTSNAGGCIGLGSPDVAAGAGSQCPTGSYTAVSSCSSCGENTVQTLSAPTSAWYAVTCSSATPTSFPTYYTSGAIISFTCKTGSAENIGYSSTGENEPSGPCRLDYPLYNWYTATAYSSDNVLQEGAVSAGSSSSIPSGGTLAGTCFVQNQLSSVGTGSTASVTSDASYSCSGDYNSSTPNKCLTSTSGSIVYSASCPSPGSGTISSVTAIPNSCLNNYNNTATANVTEKANGTSVYSNTGIFTGTHKINITSPLKSFISTCSQSKGNCTFPLSISSSKPGIIDFKDLSIPYSYNVSALYTHQYNTFNDTFNGKPINANSTVLSGSTLNATEHPFETIVIPGFDSKVNCQLGFSGSESLYPSAVNSSNICPIKVNLTTAGNWQSFSNSSVGAIIVFNKAVKPITQTIQTASQDTALQSTPGVEQYISVPITLQSNASDYGVTSNVNTSILTPSINDFSLGQTQTTFAIPNGTTHESIVYKGNKVLSKETIITNAAQWKANNITIEDTWNNTSPYNFTNLTKTYLLSKGSKFLNCYINSTSVKGTDECTVTNNSNGSMSVKIVYTKALKPGVALDPAVVAEAPNITETQTSYTQALSSKLTCTTSYSSPSCSNSTLVPSLSSTATFNNTGSFAYPKINLSATIPNSTLSGDIIIEAPNGSSILPYYTNLSKGVINWTTTNFAGNSVENWIITVKTQPLQIAFTKLSSGNIFEQEITYSIPPSSPALTYTSISLKETTPFLTEYSFSLSPSFIPEVTSVGSLSTKVSVSSSRTSSYFTNSISSLTGSTSIYTEGQIGIPPKCSIAYQNQTSVIVGQNAKYYYFIQCYNNNSISLANYIEQFPMPSTSFDIQYSPAYQNKTLISPLTITPLSYNPGTFIPLTASYDAHGYNYFVITYEIQPLSFSYTTTYPPVVYAGIPAPVLINTSLEDAGSIPISNVSYSIPITIGYNASFITNGTTISSSKSVNGTYTVEFPTVKPHSIDYGTLFYYIPTLNTVVEPSLQQYTNNTKYIYTPVYVDSISPIPLNTTYLLANATFEGLGSCASIQEVYSNTSADSLSGHDLKFTCKDNNKEVLISMGSFDLSQSKFIIIKSNPVLKAVIISSPSPSLFHPVISFFVTVGKDIYTGLKDLWGVLTHL
jgi:hypothetical protein